MHDAGGDSSSGGLPYPFVPRGGGETHQGDTASVGLPPPFQPGSAEPPPEVLIDQVAGLASSAAAMPSIDEFLYEEHAQDVITAAAPPPPPREASARPTTPAYVPPLPGFTGQASPPAPARAHDFAARTPAQPYAAPAPPRAEPRYQPPRTATPAVARPAMTEPPPRSGDSWASGEWQSYDWRSAGALAPEERARAAQAWSDLDWENETKNRVRERNEAIAAALEGIARRVRTGELLVHGHSGMSEEAAAAAALAALLARRP
jgi:hypothetical protein